MAASTAQEPRTEVRAVARFVRTAPRKAGLVVDQIRGRSVPEARTILAFMTRDAARDVRKVLDSAVANAEANHGLIGDDLYVAGAFVGAGPTLKRWRARARGRVGRIRKRTCHITIELALPSGETIPEPIPQPAPAPPAEEPVAEELPEEEAEPEAEEAEEEPAEAAPAAEAEEAKAEVPVEDAPEAEVEAKPKRARRTRKKTEETDEEKGA